MNRISFIGKVKIIDEEKVIKEEVDLREQYKYLQSRNFYNFIPLIDYKDNRATYEYKEEIKYDDNLKSIDLIDTVANLHNKTSYKKAINPKTNKDIYLNIKGYIKYLKIKYEEELEDLELLEYPRPSEQIFMYNYSKLISSLDFISKELEEWFKLVSNNTEERVVLTHGNLDLSHFIRSDNDYLINWKNSKEDSPIKDLIILYHNIWDKVNFKEVLEEYLRLSELSKTEQKLLFINISLPLEYTKTNNEVLNTINCVKMFNYLYKTEELIRPYYSVKQIKEE